MACGSSSPTSVRAYPGNYISLFLCPCTSTPPLPVGSGIGSGSPSHNPITPSPLAVELSSVMSFQHTGHPQTSSQGARVCSHQIYSVPSFLPFLQKATLHWVHRNISSATSRRARMTYISRDWNRLCLAFVPCFRKNNVMNNPFKFLHLV